MLIAAGFGALVFLGSWALDRLAAQLFAATATSGWVSAAKGLLLALATAWFAYVWLRRLAGDRAGMRFGDPARGGRGSDGAHAELRASEERYRSCFEFSPVAYQSLDEAGRYIHANRELGDLLGYAPEELLGRTFCEFWSERSREAFSEIDDAFKHEGRVSRELGLLRSERRPFSAKPEMGPSDFRSGKWPTVNAFGGPRSSCVRPDSVLRFAPHSVRAPTNDLTAFRETLCLISASARAPTPIKHPVLRLRGGRRTSLRCRCEAWSGAKRASRVVPGSPSAGRVRD